MRSSGLVSGILFALGVSFLVGAIVALSEDYGSCPAEPAGLLVGCDHTFPGTSIFILPVVRLLEVLSVLAVGAGIVVFVKYRNRPRPDLIPKRSKVSRE